MVRCLILSFLFFAFACSYPKPRNFEEAVFLKTVEVDTAELRDYGNGVTRFTVGPFDRLHVSVWQYPDLSGEVLVKDDGTVFLPNAGNIPLSGLGLRDAQRRLVKSLEPFVPNPQVDVRPTEVRSNVFFVAGEFARPGAYPILRPMRLGEAIARAGGLTENALADSAYLSRGGRAWPVNLQHAFTAGGDGVYLQAGDVLYVPSRQSSLVYVLGEVRSPSAVPISNGGLGAIQAIAAAGGITAGASEEEVAILRRVGNQIQLRVLDLDAALKYGSGAALLFRLEPGDIVWVPPSGIANWNRALELITPTLDTILVKPVTFIRDYLIIRDIIDED